MDTVEEHSHSFLPETWPFSEPANTACFTNAKLLENDLPVIGVFHDHDGEWQFLSGDIEEGDECKIICFGCIYERTPDIAILNSLPTGWMAERSSIDGTWKCEPQEREEDEGQPIGPSGTAFRRATSRQVLTSLTLEFNEKALLPNNELLVSKYCISSVKST